MSSQLLARLFIWWLITHSLISEMLTPTLPVGVAQHREFEQN